MAELADAQDLKSWASQGACGFDSHPRHHVFNELQESPIWGKSPKTADFAEMAIKGYFVSVFTIFIHVVTIQLAATFLTLPEQTNNSLISIAVAIGLLLTLLKIPSFLMQMVFFSKGAGMVKHVGGQVMNIMSASKNKETTATTAVVKTPRKTVNL